MLDSEVAKIVDKCTLRRARIRERSSHVLWQVLFASRCRVGSFKRCIDGEFGLRFAFATMRLIEPVHPIGEKAF